MIKTPNTLQNLLIALIVLATSTTINSQFLKTSGKDILDKDNQPIILRGLGLGGWMLQEPYMMKVAGGARNQKEFKSKIETLIGNERTNEFYDAWLENFITKKDIDSMAEWGFNSVRVPLHYNLFTLPIEEENGDENTWLDKGFEIIDNLLDWCEDNNLYLILDLHAAPGGQGYDEGISDYDPNLPSLWESLRNKNKTVALWGKLAERYKEREWIGGYDILNEPNWNLNGNEIRELYVQITNAIRAHDQNHIIFVEGNWFANDFSGLTPPWDNNMVYSFHKYWNDNTVNTIQWVLDMRDQYDIPLWMGESGENSNVWFKEAISLFENNNIGWAWWPSKRLETTVSITSIPINEKYNEMVSFFKGEAPVPNSDSAYQGLMDLANSSNIINNIFNRDVIDAMIRQPFSDELAPYTNNSIPGIILATHYDLGSQGIAYNDTEYGNYSGSNGTTSWNLGWVFRNDGVDISTYHSGESSSNGYSVGYVRDREWMKYTVNVEQDGYYDISTKYSALTAGGKIQFEWNNSIISPIRGLGNTGSYSNFSTVTSKTSFLKQGQNIFKVRIIGNVEFNVESFEFKFSDNQSPDFKHIGAIIENNDDEIKLSLNKNIASQINNFQSFTVKANGTNVNISNVEIDVENQNNILIKVDEALSFYDDVSVSYLNGGIVSDSGESLGNFTNFPVQNLIEVIKLVPGKIEAEDYESSSGIGIEETNDTGLGFNIKDLHPGDNATYEIDVQESSNYLAQFRIASERQDLSFSLSFKQGSEVVYFKSYSFSGTNGWQAWQTVDDEIYLEHGKYTLLFTVLGNEFNLNWMNFELIDESERLNIPGKIEAENFDTQSGLVISETFDSGGGLQLGYLDSGDFAKYRVKIENQGTYKLSSRVATDYDEAGFSLELENTDGSKYNVGFINTDQTGGWNNWETVEQNTSLPQGNFIMKMSPENSALNINWYEFEYVSHEMQYNLVPSKIEAEDYFVQYGVEIESCSDDGGGKNISYIDSGDYMKYLISISKPGYYTMSLRTAGYESGEVRATISNDTSPDELLQTFSTPQTGGWQTWQTVEENIVLTPGNYTLTLNIIKGGFNFNWIKFEFNDGEGFNVPGKIQAEDFWKQSGLSLENCLDEGGGSNLSYMDQGDYSNYIINVETSDTYIVKARVASDSGGAGFSLSFDDGLNYLELDEFEINNTGGWQSWETIEKEIDLAAGTYDMKMNVTKSLFNLNWIEFETVNKKSEDEEEEIVEGINRILVYPNPTKDRITIESNISFQQIIIRDIQGRIVQNLTVTEKSKYSIDTPFSSGYYFISLIDSSGNLISNNSFVINKNIQ